jgi:two-component system response regulator CpxR
MLEKSKVLLVEDDLMIVKMYEKKLKLEGFEILSVFNGEEGLAALKNYHPDIILLDIMMPRLNGLDTLKILKANPVLKSIPVIILTNLGDRPEDMEKCKELGAADYLVKANLSLNDLSGKIKNILDQQK